MILNLKNSKFSLPETSYFLRDVDIEKLLGSNKISFGGKTYKYFIGYFHNHHKVKALHIMLPKTTAYVKIYDGQTKWMYFLIENDNLLEKYNTIYDKVSTDIKRNLIASLSIIKHF